MINKIQQFSLYLSFFFILLGGLLTFTASTQGKLHLQVGKSANVFIDKRINTTYQLPFEVTLHDFQIRCYPGTSAPSDYVSTLKIKENNKEIMGQISMNKVFSYKGFRFYQSGYDKDEKGSILLVKSDRYGLFFTYSGYFLLLAAMIGYFFLRNTKFRKYLKHPALKRTFLVPLFLFLTNEMTVAETKTLPKDIAQKMGELQVLYNNRICPLETFARDFTLKLYGKSTYKLQSSLQVLSGLSFYPEIWKNEPIIKIKDKKVQQLLGINGKYASFSDFFYNDKNYKLELSLARIRLGENIKSAKEIVAADEKIQLLYMLQMGMFFKVFPIVYEQNTVWYSPADELPDYLSENEILLISGYFNLLKEYAVQKKWQTVETILNQLIVFQKKSGAEGLLSPQKIKAEQLYNKLNVPKYLAFSNLFIGIIVLIFFLRRRKFFL